MPWTSIVNRARGGLRFIAKVIAAGGLNSDIRTWVEEHIGKSEPKGFGVGLEL